MVDDIMSSAEVKSDDSEHNDFYTELDDFILSLWRCLCIEVVYYLKYKSKYELVLI